MTKNPKRRKAEPKMALDAWSRFERTVDTVMKAKPKHRAAKPKPDKPKKKTPSK